MWEAKDQEATLELISAIQKKLAALPKDPARSDPIWQNGNGFISFEQRVIRNPTASPSEWETRSGRIKSHQKIGMTMHFETKSATELQQQLRVVHDTIMEVVQEKAMKSGTAHAAEHNKETDPGTPGIKIG